MPDTNKKKKFIDPCNPCTGEVSVMAIMENIKNGYDRFPENMGNCVRKLIKPNPNLKSSVDLNGKF